MNMINVMDMSTYPEHDRIVIAELVSVAGNELTTELTHVSDEDCTWRTADDGSEINEWVWTVRTWRYLT